jgi:hypothetical protein
MKITSRVSALMPMIVLSAAALASVAEHGQRRHPGAVDFASRWPDRVYPCQRPTCPATPKRFNHRVLTVVSKPTSMTRQLPIAIAVRHRQPKVIVRGHNRGQC